MPQSSVLVLDSPVHETHYMEFEPCLFLECNKCGLTAKLDSKKLSEFCKEDLIKP